MAHLAFFNAVAVVLLVPATAVDCNSEVISEGGVDADATCFMQHHAARKVNKNDQEVKLNEGKEKHKAPPELGKFDPSARGLTDWDKQFISDKYGGPFYDGQEEIPPFKGKEVKAGMYKPNQPNAIPDGTQVAEVSITTAAPVAVPAARDASATVQTPLPTVAAAAPKLKMSMEEQAQEIVGSRVAILLALFGLGSCILIYLFLLEPGENRRYFQMHQTHPLPGWGIASYTICVFCSYLIISAVRSLVAALLGPGAQDYPLTLDTFLLIIYFMLFQFLLYRHKEDWWINEGIGQMGAFIMGFAGTDTMGSYFSTQRCFSGTLLSSISTVIVTLMILAAVLVVLTVVRANVHDQADGRSDAFQGRTWDTWHETSKRCDNLVAAVALGYLGMQCVSYAQSGEYYPMHARPTTATPRQAGELFLTSAVFGTLFLVTMYSFGHHQDRWRTTHRFQVFDMARCTTCMATSWCALSAFGWLFWSDSIWFWSGGFTPGKALTAALLSACAVSIAALPVSIAIIHSEFMRRLFFQLAEPILGLSEDASDGEGELYGTKDVVTGLGLAMGVSWASAFVLAARAWGMALAGLSPRVETTVSGPVFQAFICLALCAWILPGWALYIMPLAVGHESKLNSDLKEGSRITRPVSDNTLTDFGGKLGGTVENLEEDAFRMMGSVLNTTGAT